MDYSNFIKNFYRYAFNELKKFKDYYGKMAYINKDLEIPNNFLHKDESESMFLPQKSVNIDAPVNYFVDFMDYYIKLMPDLEVVFANKQRINDLYNNVVNMGVLQDDEKTMKYIELVVGVGIKTLEEQGILSYGN